MYENCGMVRKVPRNVKVPALQFCWRLQRPLARISKWYQDENRNFVLYLETPPNQPDFGLIYRPDKSITTLDATEVRMLFKREHHFDAEARR